MCVGGRMPSAVYLCRRIMSEGLKVNKGLFPENKNHRIKCCDVKRSKVNLMLVSLLQSAYLVSGSECGCSEQMRVCPAVPVWSPLSQLSDTAWLLFTSCCSTDGGKVSVWSVTAVVNGWTNSLILLLLSHCDCLICIYVHICFGFLELLWDQQTSRVFWNNQYHLLTQQIQTSIYALKATGYLEEITNQMLI